MSKPKRTYEKPPRVDDDGKEIPEPEPGNVIDLHGQPSEKERERFAALNQEARSLADFADTAPDPADTLLGERYLCRRGGLLLIGSSGMGKSSAMAQAAICWALGKPAFGIDPAEPLSSVLFQAENDDGDMHEMAEGIMSAMGLSPEEREQVREKTWARNECTMMGADFLEKVVTPVVACRAPDLVLIDPLQCYAGCDPVDTAGVQEFLYAGLNPILRRFNAGAVLAHHTPKTNHRDASNWTAGDWMYSGAGSAAITNWARAIMAVEDCGGSVFRWRAAKRGKRIGWRDPEDGTRLQERLFRHADHGIFWEPATEQDLRDAQQAGGTEKWAEHILELVPPGAWIPKRDLIDVHAPNRATKAMPKLAQKKARAVVETLLENGDLKEHTGAKNKTYVARHDTQEFTE